MTADPTPDDLMIVNRDRLDEDQVRAWADYAAAEIERLQAALRDALTLLPPERWGLLLPQFQATRTEALSDDR